VHLQQSQVNFFFLLVEKTKRALQKILESSAFPKGNYQGTPKQRIAEQFFIKGILLQESPKQWHIEINANRNDYAYISDHNHNESMARNHQTP
jgi:hypothetical protein